MYRSAMHPLIRIVLLSSFALISAGGIVPGQQPSASPMRPNPGPTPFQVVNLPLEVPSAATSLRDVEASIAKIQATADAIAGPLAKLINELDLRMTEDTRLLSARPPLEMLYRMKLTWQDLSDKLLASDRELTQLATRLEEKLARLDNLDTTWQATLQSANLPGTPPEVAQSIQSLIDSIERARSTAQPGRARLLAVRNRLSETEARAQDVLSLVEEVQIRAMKGLLIRDSAPIWNLGPGLSREWEKESGESFSSQLKASTAFAKRFPSAFGVITESVLNRTLRTQG
jgi:hypothetical protein